MTDQEINQHIAEALKQRDIARERQDILEEKRHRATIELKKAYDFINALVKVNEELREEVGAMMFTIETMQHEINKLKK